MPRLIAPAQYTMKRNPPNAATRASQHDVPVSSAATTPIRHISAYDKYFERYVKDHGVVFEPTTTPQIVNHLQSIVRRRRASLDPDTFPDLMCHEILNTVARYPTQGELFSDAFPHLTGSHLHIPHAQNHHFSNLANMMADEDEVIAQPQPDYYDGHAASPENHRLRKELYHYIVPLETSDLPMLPNLFVELKGRGGDAYVARLQAVQDGVFGARGMKRVRCLALRDDASDEEKMGCAVVITYSARTIEAHAIYTMPSTSAEREEDYHVSTFDTWTLAVHPDIVRSATQALRNLRDWAAQEREIAIREANERMALRSSPSVKVKDCGEPPNERLSLPRSEKMTRQAHLRQSDHGEDFKCTL